MVLRRSSVTTALFYKSRETVLHKLNPLTKLAVILIITAALFNTDNSIKLAITLTIVLILLYLGKVLRSSLELITTLLPMFILLFTVCVLSWMYVADKPPTTAITIATFVTTRLIILTLALPILYSTTRLSDIARSLLLLRIPFSVVLPIILAYRFIPVLLKDLATVYESQVSRGLSFRTKNPVKIIKNLVPVTIPAVIVATLRAIDLAEVLALRGVALSRVRFRPSITHYDILLLTAVIATVTILLIT